MPVGQIPAPEIATLLAAVRFAAEKHSKQRRKNVEASPYINHPIEVAELLARVVGVADVDLLTAALLHDTVEDTETSLEELTRRFGPRVSALVAEVTDDKSLAKQVRKQLQIEHAPSLSPSAKLIKLADKISNVRDLADAPPGNWPLERRREYLDWSERVVAGLRGVHERLERAFDEVVVRARSTLSA